MYGLARSHREIWERGENREDWENRENWGKRIFLKKRENKGNRRKIQLIRKRRKFGKIMNMGENCSENKKIKIKGERQNKGTK